jgi:hypothetical protein
MHKPKGARNKTEKIWIYRDKATGQPKGDCTISYEVRAAPAQA